MVVTMKKTMGQPHLDRARKKEKKPNFLKNCHLDDVNNY